MSFSSPVRTSVFAFVLCFLAIAGWQAVYCHLVAADNPTALFLVGDRQPYSDELRKGAYIYRDSLGYDGMLYRAVAHDPLLARGNASAVDDPRYRWRRILLPGLAALLGGGDPVRTDLAYILAADTLLALGGVCFVRLIAGWMAPVPAALLYCLLPAVVATTDRMVLDGVALAAFLGLLLIYRHGGARGLVAVSAALPLIRETGILFTLAAAADHAIRRRHRVAAWLLAATAPALAWFAFVASRTGPSGAAETLLTVPLRPYLVRLFTPVARPVTPATNLLLQFLDLCALGAFLFAVGRYLAIAIRETQARKWSPETILLAPAVLLAACFAAPGIVTEPYDFMRQNSALMIWTFLGIYPGSPRSALCLLAASSAPLLVYRAAPLLRAVAP